MRDVLSLPHGEQPARVAADPQREGVEELNAPHQAKQAASLRQMGLDDLLRTTMRSPRHGDD